MNPELLEKIGPKRNNKYSPNLYCWLIKNMKLLRHIEVYSDRAGTLWIGTGPDKYFFSGVRLISVLCNGGRAETMAWVKKQVGPMKRVSDFWKRYLRDGRCAIDRNHNNYFIGDETRWRVTGNRRECLWCGNCKQRLKRWTEHRKREAWVNNENN